MTSQQRTDITGLITAVGVTLSTLAGLPQTLGPFADILPEKYKVTIITVSLFAIVIARAINALWPFIAPEAGKEPADIATTAGKPLPTIPPAPAQSPGYTIKPIGDPTAAAEAITKTAQSKT